MKIQGNHPSLKKQESTQVEGRKGQSVSNKGGTESTKAQKGVQANSFTTGKMKAKIDSTPDMDMDKVKALKDKIKNGDYSIDFKKLANNLIKDSIFEDSNEG